MGEEKKIVVDIKYPPSGKEFHFNDGSWTNIESELRWHENNGIFRLEK